MTPAPAPTGTRPWSPPEVPTLSVRYVPALDAWEVAHAPSETFVQLGTDFAYQTLRFAGVPPAIPKEEWRRVLVHLAALVASDHGSRQGAARALRLAADRVRLPRWAASLRCTQRA